MWGWFAVSFLTRGGGGGGEGGGGGAGGRGGGGEAFRTLGFLLKGMS